MSVAEVIDDLKFVLSCESHRMGAVSSGLLKNAIASLADPNLWAYPPQTMPDMRVNAAGEPDANGDYSIPIPNDWYYSTCKDSLQVGKAGVPA